MIWTHSGLEFFFLRFDVRAREGSFFTVPLPEFPKKIHRSNLCRQKSHSALYEVRNVCLLSSFSIFFHQKKLGQEFPSKNDGSMKLVIFMMHLESDDLQAFYGAKVVSYWHHVFWIWFYWTLSLCPSFLEMISSNPSTSSNGQSQRIRAKQLMSGRHPVLAQAS